jgi:hypothetical protein
MLNCTPAELAVAMEITRDLLPSAGFIHATDCMSRAVLWHPPVMTHFPDCLIRQTCAAMIPVVALLARTIAENNGKDPLSFLKALGGHIREDSISIRDDIYWALAEATPR